MTVYVYNVVTVYLLLRARFDLHGCPVVLGPQMDVGTGHSSGIRNASHLQSGHLLLSPNRVSWYGLSMILESDDLLLLDNRSPRTVPIRGTFAP